MSQPTQTLRRCGALAILAAISLLGAARAGPGAVPEYELKAVLIYKVAKFVRWPEGTFASAGAGLRLCILGHDDFGASIDALAGQRLQGQAVIVERLSALPQGTLSCQILFISRSESLNLATDLAALALAPILTISDIDGFANQGGMIELSTADSKIRFQINAAASRHAGLEIGAQLLQLATLVEPHPVSRP